MLKKLTFLFFLSNFSFAQVDFELPELGDRVSGAISEAEVELLSEQFLQQVYSQASLIVDPVIQEYSELLLYRLSETSLVNDRNFTVLLIDDPSLNAFAAPGGIVGINGGLFLNADNESQFASVLCHELAHLSQRHFQRNVLRSQDRNLASALILVSSIAVAIATNNPGAFIAGPALLQQQSLRYSRAFEREADRFGFENCVASGYDPRAMGEMFENMAALRRFYGDNIPEFLLTHPISSTRVSDAFNAADQLGDIDGVRNSIDYRLIKGRLEADYEVPPINAIRIFENRLLNNENIENIFGYSRALLLNGRFNESLIQVDKLLALYPKNLILNTSKIEILRESQKFDEALILVNNQLEVSPKNFPLTIEKAKILRGLRKTIAAEEVLRDTLLRRNSDPNLWFLLSEIQKENLNVGGYHQSRAEYFILLGQSERALNELQFALKLSQDNFQTYEIIMTKINSLREKLNKRI
tara:strand:+ start:6024 stop:7436 length:1413 start_codon:yes stop_codon:yes gene_type:complete